MDARDLVTRVQAHYVAQFEAFIAAQRAEPGEGASEIKLSLGSSDGLYRGLYCADFLRREADGAALMMELRPERRLSFQPLSGVFGAADLTIDALTWDDVMIGHDLGEEVSGLDAWFQHWFDPEDAWQDPSASLSGGIHSLVSTAGLLTTDLGTSEPDAFWSLLETLVAAGARTLKVSASRGG